MCQVMDSEVGGRDNDKSDQILGSGGSLYASWQTPRMREKDNIEMESSDFGRMPECDLSSEGYERERMKKEGYEG